MFDAQVFESFLMILVISGLFIWYGVALGKTEDRNVISDSKKKTA